MGIPRHVYVVLLGGLLAISVSPILVRYAAEAPGEVVAVWRTVTAALLLAVPAFVRSRAEIASFSRREWTLIGTAGIFLGLHFVAFISSLYYTTVASASVLVSLSPIFMGIIGWVLLRERLTRREVIGIVVAIAATIMLQMTQGEAAVEAAHPLLGNSLALTAAALVAVYLIIGRVVRQHRSWLAYVAPLYAVTALTTLTVALLRGSSLFGWPWYIYGLCVLMALIPQLLGHGAFNYAIKYFPAATLGVASLAEPIGASMLALGLFGEVPTLPGVAAMTVILLSVAFVLYTPKASSGSS
jgi:drug/metabolite transporter (DMT)-like permease